MADERHAAHRSALDRYDSRYFEGALWSAVLLTAVVAIGHVVAGSPTDALGFGSLSLAAGVGAWLLRRGYVTHQATAQTLLVASGFVVWGRLIRDAAAAAAPAELVSSATASIGLVAAGYAIFQRSTARLIAVVSIGGSAGVLFTSTLADGLAASHMATACGVLLCVDIAVSASRDHHEFAKRQEKLATHDSLTQLYNRRAAMARFPATESGQTVLLIDIDRFKAVNDTYGHAQGDEMLKQVAEVLREGLRRDDVLARWGGEEFLVILGRGVGPVEGSVVADRLRRSVEDAAIGVTVSVGFGPLEPSETVEECLVRVDRALYRAKDEGRNLALEATAA